MDRFIWDKEFNRVKQSTQSNSEDAKISICVYLLISRSSQYDRITDDLTSAIARVAVVCFMARGPKASINDIHGSFTE